MITKVIRMEFSFDILATSSVVCAVVSKILFYNETTLPVKLSFQGYISP